MKNKEISNSVKTYDFYRENDVTQLNGIPILGLFGAKKDRWYIDLPEWKGPKANLEMVAGADTVLDILSDGKNRITISFTDDKENLQYMKYRSDIKLRHIEDGIYKVNPDQAFFLKAPETNFPNEIWLCDVTTFIFGKYPDEIYLYAHENDELGNLV